MTKFLKTKGLRLLILVLVVVALTAGLAAHRGGRAGLLSNLTATLTTTVKQAVFGAVAWLEDIYAYIYQYDQLEAENETLRAQLAALQEELRIAQDANEENIRLRELLGFQEKHADFVLESARVVDRSTSNWSNTLTISKGESSGIALRSPVITESGALVGQVTELGSNWATVYTIIDVDTNVGALVGEAGNAAILVGDFSLMGSGQAKLTYLTEGTQLLEGDNVLSSGKGGIFPQGLLIGSIAEVHTEAGGQTPYGVIQPACDLDAVSQVFIIQEFDVVE